MESKVRQISPEALKATNQNKQAVMTGLSNIKIGLRKLEMDVQTNPSLKNYIELFKGISDLVGVAENQAASGEFTKSNATLSNLVEKLKGILIAHP